MPSPTTAFFISTKLPARAPRPSRDPGRSRVYGPTVASGPISDCSQTAWMMLAPAPITVSRSTTPGPTCAPAWTVVCPSSWVDGPISTSGARVTWTSSQVLAGSMIVTPARIQCSSSRSLNTRRAWASCTRSFTPWISVASAATRVPTGWPSPRRMPTTSVRYSWPCALADDTRLIASASSAPSKA